MDASHDVSRAVADAARRVGRPVDRTLLLRDIAGAALQSVPDFDHASITLLRPDGGFETAASTSALSVQLDDLQYAAGEGPCLDTARSARVVAVPRLHLERRWPAYVAHAVALGVRSHLSVHLRLEGEDSVGGLNLYSTTTERVGWESIAMAELFGSYAATSSHGAGSPARPSAALESVRIIGRALAIVMARREVDANRAFEILDESAASADLPLPEYAQRVVDRDAGS